VREATRALATSRNTGASTGRPVATAAARLPPAPSEFRDALTARSHAETPLPGAGAAFPIAVEGFANTAHEMREAAEGLPDTAKPEAPRPAEFPMAVVLGLLTASGFPDALVPVPLTGAGCPEAPRPSRRAPKPLHQTMDEFPIDAKTRDAASERRQAASQRQDQAYEEPRASVASSTTEKAAMAEMAKATCRTVRIYGMWRRSWCARAASPRERRAQSPTP